MDELGPPPRGDASVKALSLRRRFVAVYDVRTLPEKVTGGTKYPEIAERLKTGPVLGAHTPIGTINLLN